MPQPARLAARAAPALLASLTAAALLLSTASLEAQAEPLFRTHFIKPGANVGLVVGAGDLTGDGLPDVACTVNGKLKLLTGDGIGNLSVTPLLEYSTGSSVNGLAVGDLDGDGRADVVTGGGPFVHVLLGSGGGLAPPVTYAGTDNVAELRLADVNGDGHLDIIAANSVGPRASVFLNAGDGSFLPRTDFGPTGSHPDSVAVADIDGDGDLDLAFGNRFDDSVSIFFNDGAAHFTPKFTLDADFAPTAVALGDLDGDGKTDLAVVLPDKLRWFKGNGLGAFGTPVQLAVDVFGTGLEIADVDEDGHLDLVAGSSAAGLAIVRGHGDGTFDAAALFGGGADSSELTLADMNLDGELDVVLLNFPSAGVSVQLGRGDGSFGPHVATSGSPTRVALVPIDGDELLDAVTLTSGGVLDIALGAGNGGFVQTTKIAALANPGAALVAQDLTGDGITDLAVIATTPSFPNLAVYPGLGTGAFAPPLLTPAGALLSDLIAADLDGNGVQDFVATSNGAGTVRIYFGIDGTHWAPAAITSVGLSATALTAADFDGDLDLDLAVCSAAPGSDIALLFNDGTGTFDAPAHLPTGPFPLERGPSTGDLNGDGLPDLVVVGQFGNNVGVFLSAGRGELQPLTYYPASQNPNGSALGDVDGDGDLDIVLAQMQLGFHQGTVGVLLNDGSGHFAPQVQFTLMAGVSGVALGDVDGDGMLDVAATAQDARTLSVLLNTSGPWDDLGQALAGSNGLCHQLGEGTLLGGSSFRFTLSDALPGGATFHIVGLSALAAPFKGGVLVPNPTLINGPLPIDLAGRLVLQGTWPAGAPSGVQLWFQFWFADAGGPAGFAASNAVRATLP